MISNILAALVLFLCVLFVAISYMMLYLETRRHENKIKPSNYHKNNSNDSPKRAKLKDNCIRGRSCCVMPTTCSCVLIIGTSRTGYMAFGLVFCVYSLHSHVRYVKLTSCLNPLIYCWRQQETRKFIFRFSGIQVVNPADKILRPRVRSTVQL